MTIVKLGQVLLGGLNCILTYLIGKAIWSRRVGLIGGLITALYPALLIYHQAIMSETLYITWLLLTLLFLVLAMNNTKWYYLLLAGIATAGAQYVRPIFVLFPILICAIILLIPQYRKKIPLPYLAIFLAGSSEQTAEDDANKHFMHSENLRPVQWRDRYLYVFKYSISRDLMISEYQYFQGLKPFC